MVVAYIEIERDENGKGKGNINLIPKQEYWVILHGYSAKKLDRTVFMVETKQENIDKVIASHKDVKVYYTKKEMQLRGLSIKPGTMTAEEKDIFINMLKTKHGIDLKTEIKSGAGKSWEDYLKQDIESIGQNNVKCNNCGTINKQILSFFPQSLCTNCNNSLRFAKRHTPPFNIDAWKSKIEIQP